MRNIGKKLKQSLNNKIQKYKQNKIKKQLQTQVHLYLSDLHDYSTRFCNGQIAKSGKDYLVEYREYWISFLMFKQYGISVPTPEEYLDLYYANFQNENRRE